MNTPKQLTQRMAFRLRVTAAVLIVIAIALLLCEGFTAYADTTPRQPQPYIQNRSNWCWATCAKMVGNRYNTLYKNLSFLPAGAVIATNLSGLKDDGIGYTPFGEPTLDAGQLAIVKFIMGSDVNNAGTKTQTLNAMSYVTNYMALPLAQGLYYDGSVLRKGWKYPDATLNAGLYIIGNLLITPTFGHSVVIQGYNRSADRFTVYDVWNGETTYATKQKLLTDGFKTSAGTKPITWVYYVINPANPPKLVDYSTSYEAVPTGNSTEYGSLADFNAELSFSGDCTISGSAPFNYIIYTSVNNGGWYAVRADEHDRFTQFLNFHLKAGDVLRMYCESPRGKTTAINTVTVPRATARGR